MMKVFQIILLVVLLVSCTVTSKPSQSQRSCEQQYQADLARGVAGHVALGDYAQCLIDRGSVVHPSLVVD